MKLKRVLFCASAFLVQSLAAQCISYPGFPVPIAEELPSPSMSVYSDNLLIEGPVIISGRMPFFGTVAIEGAFPTAGAGAVTYGCGECGVGMVTEIPVAPVGAPFEYGVIDGYSYNGLTPSTCGSRVMY